MKKFTGILAILTMLLIVGCDMLFPPEETAPAKTKPSFSGSITNGGASGITNVKVGVFQNQPTPANYTNDDAGGKITTISALTPKTRGVITDSDYTVTYPALEDLPINKDANGHRYDLLAWNDADADGLLDVGEYNTQAKVEANHVPGVAGKAFLSSVAYSNLEEVWDYHFTFKYTDADTLVSMPPDSITDKTGFNFEMNF
jgi:hypothetical protein